MTSIERPLSVVVYLYVQQMHKRSHGSVVYKRAGMHFVEQQNLQKHRAMMTLMMTCFSPLPFNLQSRSLKSELKSVYPI